MERESNYLTTSALLENPRLPLLLGRCLLSVYTVHSLERRAESDDAAGQRAREALEQLRQLLTAAHHAEPSHNKAAVELLPRSASLDEDLSVTRLEQLALEELIRAARRHLREDAPVHLYTALLSERLEVRLKDPALLTPPIPEERRGYDELLSHRFSLAELEALRAGEQLPLPEGVTENQGLYLSVAEHPPTLARAARGRLQLIDEERSSFGLTPRNDEQRVALELLLDPEVQLVCLLGVAGTGKTLLTLAAGCAQCVEERRYQQLFISRALTQLGPELGFLPGTLEEKLAPWSETFRDAFSVLFRGRGGEAGRRGGEGGFAMDYLLEQGKIAIEPLNFIRGRSIEGRFLFIDEAQNLSPHEIKTILTRVGAGSKIVLSGDIYQIDNPKLDLFNNGLSLAARRFAGHPLAGVVTLSRSERSPLAALAAARL